MRQSKKIRKKKKIRRGKRTKRQKKKKQPRKKDMEKTKKAKASKEMISPTIGYLILTLLTRIVATRSTTRKKMMRTLKQQRISFSTMER